MIEQQFVTYAQEIVFGAGSFDRTGELVSQFGWQRLMLCTSPSLRQEGRIDALQQVLGPQLVGTFEMVQAHVQDFQLAEALAIADAHQADAIVGLGGGSSIGMAKAISRALGERRGDQSLTPVIAIPSTYAGSEMTPVYGVTHTSDGLSRKITIRDPRTVPRLVIYDPLLTLDLPSQVTSSSGINALAHCVEALYSSTRNSLATAAARAGIEHIVRALPRCAKNGADVGARDEMQVGAHLAAAALATTSMGLHHGLCHVLGGSAAVPHGIANSIILPHAMRFNLDATGSQLALVARSMGLSVDGRDDHAAAEAAVAGVYHFIGQLGLPQRLRDAGVVEEDLPQLASMALQSRAVQDNPKPVTDAAQTEAVLRAAW